MEITIQNIRFLAFSGNCPNLYAKMSGEVKEEINSNSYNIVEFYIVASEYEIIRKEIKKLKLSLYSKKKVIQYYKNKTGFYFRNVKKEQLETHYLIRIEPPRLSKQMREEIKLKIQYYRDCIEEQYQKLRKRVV